MTSGVEKFGHALGKAIKMTAAKLTDEKPATIMYRTNLKDVPKVEGLKRDDGWVDMQVQFLIDKKSAGADHVVGWTVLKPGARFVNLDMSKAPNPAWKACFDLYFYGIVPLLGGIISGSRQAYTYLPNSLTHHPGAEALRERFAAAGFEHTGFVRLMGGSLAIHYGAAR